MAGAAALAARERRNQGCFLNLWALPRCCSRIFFHRSLWIPLRWGTENIRRYVDLTGYLKSKSGLCSKMPPTAILSIFLHKPMAGPHCRTGFLRGAVPRLFLEFSLWRSTGSCKKKSSSLLELRTWFRFRLYKRKIGLLIQNDRRWKSKKWPKDVVYLSSHFWICLFPFCNIISNRVATDDPVWKNSTANNCKRLTLLNFERKSRTAGLEPATVVPIARMKVTGGGGFGCDVTTCDFRSR